MYQNPGTNYYESIIKGYDGINGGLITNINSTDVLGIFICKINNVASHPKNKTLHTEKFGISRGFIMPSNVIFENILVKKYLEIFPNKL